MTEKYVKPSREAVIDALWGTSKNLPVPHIDREEMVTAQADAVLDLLPGRSEVEVDREALRRFVDSFCDDEAGEVEHVVSADGTSGFALTGGNDAHAVLCKAASALWPGESRADRLAADGGADRG